MKYEGVDRSLLQHFKGCHDRVRDGKAPSIQWPRTRAGYLEFFAAIGPKPKKEGKWSVGRIRHSLGYCDGNIQWELHKFNSVKRKGTRHQNSHATVVELKRVKFKRGSLAYYRHQRRIAREYWSKKANKKKQSTMLRRAWKRGAFNNRRAA